MPKAAHGLEPPSAWVAQWSHLLRAQSDVLDLACGHGRHMRHFAAMGHRVTGIDRDPNALVSASAWGETMCADIENGAWPLVNKCFDAVLVTHYLWRPLWPHILASLAPQGVLIYETFAAGNETVGKPSRADFLLQPGELLARCQSLRVVAFEDGFLEPPARFIQRIVAVRHSEGSHSPVRYPLTP